MNSSCYITLQESFNTYFTSSHIAPAVSIHTILLCELNKISWGQQESEVTSQRRFYMPFVVNNCLFVQMALCLFEADAFPAPDMSVSAR